LGLSGKRRRLHWTVGQADQGICVEPMPVPNYGASKISRTAPMFASEPK
jgi:hypothetical protein